MKLLLMILLFGVSFSTMTFSQEKKLSKSEIKKQKEKRLDSLRQKLNGVKYADLGFSKAQEQIVLNNSSSLDAQILIGIIDYLKKDIGLTVIVTQEQRSEAIKMAKSQCDYVKFIFDVGSFKSSLGAIGNYPFSFSFLFCDNSNYSFETKLRVSGLTIYSKAVRDLCNFEFLHKKEPDESQKLKVASNKIIISYPNFIKYLDSAKRKSDFEGVYQLFSSNVNTSNYTIGLYHYNDSLRIIYFSGADFNEDWSEGELKGNLYKTMSENDFLADCYTLDKRLVNGSVTFLNINSFELRINNQLDNNGVDKFVRVK